MTCLTIFDRCIFVLNRLFIIRVAYIIHWVNTRHVHVLDLWIARFVISLILTFLIQRQKAKRLIFCSILSITWLLKRYSAMHYLHFITSISCKLKKVVNETLSEIMFFYFRLMGLHSRAIEDTCACFQYKQQTVVLSTHFCPQKFDPPF